MLLGRHGAEMTERSNAYSGWKVRNSWDQNISAWDFKPVEGDYISCQIKFEVIDFTRIKYQEEEASWSLVTNFLRVNAQQNTEDSRKRSSIMLSGFPIEGDQGDEECYC